MRSSGASHRLRGQLALSASAAGRNYCGTRHTDDKLRILRRLSLYRRVVAIRCKSYLAS
jgi:hypothetical protein